MRSLAALLSEGADGVLASLRDKTRALEPDLRIGSWLNSPERAEFEARKAVLGDPGSDPDKIRALKEMLESQLDHGGSGTADTGQRCGSGLWSLMRLMRN